MHLDAECLNGGNGGLLAAAAANDHDKNMHGGHTRKRCRKQSHAECLDGGVDVLVAAAAAIDDDARAVGQLRRPHTQ